MSSMMRMEKDATAGATGMVTETEIVIDEGSKRPERTTRVPKVVGPLRPPVAVVPPITMARILFGMVPMTKMRCQPHDVMMLGTEVVGPSGTATMGAYRTS